MVKEKEENEQVIIGADLWGLMVFGSISGSRYWGSFGTSSDGFPVLAVKFVN